MPLTAKQFLVDGFLCQNEWITREQNVILFCGLLATHPSRLETRTKECSIQASLRVLQNPKAKRKRYLQIVDMM